MIESITINNQKWRERIGKHSISFPTRVTLLVGPNGCGKSSVLKLIEGLIIGSDRERKRFIDCATIVHSFKEKTTVYYLDTEKTLRTKSYFDDNTLTQLSMKYMSHGQAMKLYFKEVRENEKTGCVYCIDEPENGLDIKEQHILAETIQTSHHQFIIATHSPILWGMGAAFLRLLGNDSTFVRDCMFLVKSSTLIME